MPLVTTSGARLGLGATISRWSGTAFNKVGDCVDIPEVGEKRPLVKVTPSDAAGEIYIGGVPDGTELTLPFNYDATSTEQQALIDDCKANVTNQLQVAVPAATSKTLTFYAIHLDWGITPKKDAAQLLTIKVKISGGVVGPV